MWHEKKVNAQSQLRFCPLLLLGVGGGGVKIFFLDPSGALSHFFKQNDGVCLDCDRSKDPMTSTHVEKSTNSTSELPESIASSC
jgi:hypothetical protein